MEFKEELELLLNNFIIVKDIDRDNYYKVKSKIKKIRDFTTLKLGCDVIVNSSLIKLEKIPSIIDNTYNIEAFDNPKHYIIFMLVIMFLEDKAKNEQFILSNLTTFIENTLASIETKNHKVDFKDFSARKSLVDVMKYLIKLGCIKQIDGNDSLFKDSQDNEVLYENTGISHYIVRQFKEDIFTYTKPEEFINTFDEDEVLNKKRYFTYRGLLFYPALNYEDYDEDIFNYFICYRPRVVSDIKELLDGDLLIYKDIALLTTTEKQSRNSFPNSRKMLHDILLLMNYYLSDETLDKKVLTEFEMRSIIKKMHSENAKFFSKEYREMKENKFYEEVIEGLEKYSLLKRKEGVYRVSPLVHLICGKYPNNEENTSDEFMQLSIEMED